MTRLPCHCGADYAASMMLPHAVPKTAWLFHAIRRILWIRQGLSDRNIYHLQPKVLESDSLPGL